MTSESREAVINDAKVIYTLMGGVNLRDPLKAKDVIRYLSKKNTMQSVLGDRFVNRLGRFADGRVDEHNSCISCGRETQNGIFCVNCIDNIHTFTERTRDHSNAPRGKNRASKGKRQAPKGKQRMKKFVPICAAASVVLLTGLLIGAKLLSDTESPTILASDVTVSYEDDLALEDLATISDNKDEHPVLEVLGTSSDTASYDDESGTFSFTEPGIVMVSLLGRDEHGNETSKDVPVKVIDDVPPDIYASHKEYTIDVSKKSYDFASLVRAEDEIDGDLTSGIVTDASEVKFGKPGTYAVYYTVADTSENSFAGQVDVTIKDIKKPKLMLSQKAFTVTEGNSAPDYSSYATANDAYDGDVTSSISVNDSKVDYNTPGKYSVYFKVADKEGNVAKKTAKVTVKERYIPPKQSTTSSSSSSGSDGSGSSGYSSDYSSYQQAREAEWERYQREREQTYQANRGKSYEERRRAYDQTYQRHRNNNDRIYRSYH